jgi:aquaporin Z
MVVAIYEFLMTMTFMWGIMMVSGTDYSNFVPAILFIMLILGGSVSGGHVNPAVTLGVFINEWKLGQDAVLCLMIWIAQFSGAVAGAALGWLTEGVFTDGYGSKYGTDMYASWVPMVYPTNPTTGGVATSDMSVQTFFTQAFLTFIFVFTILIVKSPETAPTDVPALGAGLVSTALMGCVYAGAKLGSCFNPAIGLGIILVVQF